MAPVPDQPRRTRAGLGSIDRVLWVTDAPPDRFGGGGNIRQAYLLRALASAVETHLLVAGELDDPQVRARVAGVVELEHPGHVTHRTELQRRMVTAAHLLGGRQPSGLRVAGRARALLARHLATCHEAYDLVVVINPELAPILPADRRGASAIEFMHLLSSMSAHHAANTTGRRRLLHHADRTKAERLETWSASRYDIAVVCSEPDRAVLSRAGANSILVAPNGVNLDHFPVTPVPSASRLVLPGTLDFVPNVDGAVWFCEEILPRVRERRPDVALDIVGRRPGREMRALVGRPGVGVHGDVPTIVPFLQAARAVVVPLRIGSGTRLKALEAMAAARPVVGTAIGLEGLELVNGTHAHIADEPDVFADAIVRLLDDDGHAQRMATAGRGLVEERYGWDRIGAAYADELLRLASAASGRSRR